MGLEREHRRNSLGYLDETPPGRMLDVGCGNGDLLIRLRARGWQVQGQEIDPAAAAQARRISGACVFLGSLFLGSLPEAAFPDETFDAVTLRHVVEHLHDPIGLLRECGRILKPGGVFVVIIPDSESRGHHRFERYRRGVEPPRHLVLIDQPGARSWRRSRGGAWLTLVSPGAPAPRRSCWLRSGVSCHTRSRVRN